MDYQKYYDHLITNARSRARPEGQCEEHHVVPKCMGGNNTIENLAILTVTEHCFAHILLIKITRREDITRAVRLVLKRANKTPVSWLKRAMKKAQQEYCSYVGRTGNREGKRANGIACRDAKKGFHDHEVQSRGGRAGGKTNKESGQIYELQKQVAVIGGRASGKKSLDNKDRMFAHYRCNECGYENISGNVGRHHKKTGHTGKTKL